MPYFTYCAATLATIDFIGFGVREITRELGKLYATHAPKQRPVWKSRVYENQRGWTIVVPVNTKQPRAMIVPSISP